MNASQVIEQVKQDAAEWLEMHQNPAELVSVVLANKVVSLTNHITYLERRINHYERTASNTRT